MGGISSARFPQAQKDCRAGNSNEPDPRGDDPGPLWLRNSIAAEAEGEHQVARPATINGTRSQAMITPKEKKTRTGFSWMK